MSSRHRSVLSSEKRLSILKQDVRVPKEKEGVKTPEKHGLLLVLYTISKSKTLNKFAMNVTRLRTIFEYMSYSLIVIDTLALCMDSIEKSRNQLKILTGIDFLCLICFFIEVPSRMFLNGFKFFKIFTNLIDSLLFIINISVLAYIKEKNFDLFNDFDSDIFTTYSIIRSFQIARIYRLLISKKLWAGIAIMALEMINILKKVMNFVIILCIFLLMMSLVGRDIFIKAKIEHELNNPLIEEEVHRINFNNILMSVMANFMIFFDEDWNLIMINQMKAYGSKYMVYFLINVLLSTMFLNKFFLALLINKLIESKNMRNLIKASVPFAGFFQKMKLSYSKISQKILNTFNKTKKWTNSKAKSIKFGIIESLKKYLYDFMQIHSKTFDQIMFVVCCFSLILVALHDPFQSAESRFNKTLRFLDIPVLIILIFEILLLSLTEKNGIMQGKTIFRLVICVVYLIYFISDIQILKIFVTLRFILIIQFYKGLRKAILALLYSLWDIFQLLVFFFLFILLFAAIGVKLHKGAFMRCQNVDEEDLKKITIKTHCFDQGGDWVNPDFSFDDIFKAIDVLFLIANSSGWLSLM